MKSVERWQTNTQTHKQTHKQKTYILSKNWGNLFLPPSFLFSIFISLIVWTLKKAVSNTRGIQLILSLNANFLHMFWIDLSPQSPSQNSKLARFSHGWKAIVIAVIFNIIVIAFATLVILDTQKVIDLSSIFQNIYSKLTDWLCSLEATLLCA